MDPTTVLTPFLANLLTIHWMVNEFPIIEINQGYLRGITETLPSGKTYISFRGIPYAEPPIGNLRFRAPVPARGWTGVRDATKYGPICLQSVNMFTNMTRTYNNDQSEDCLTINVFTQEIHNELKPVMVWIHGGAFFAGSGQFGPEYILEENVVVVSINYRLEVFGFLSLDIEEAPGNAGLKDQVLALKWIKENIAKFGGDPDRVTIFGESAGAGAVTHHLISPMSQGLFHGVIAQSGCVFDEWAVAMNASKYGYRLGRHLGFNSTNPYALLIFLRKRPGKELLGVSHQIYEDKEILRSLLLPFAPSIERKYRHQESFITQHPSKYIKQDTYSKVPIILGFNSNEGGLFVKSLITNGKEIDKDFALKVPKYISDKVSNETIQMIAKKVKKFYYGDKPISNDTLYESCDLEGDLMFNNGILRFAYKLAKASTQPVYLYKFSVEGSANMMKYRVGYPDMKGALHGDDLFYLFKNDEANLNPGTKEWKVMKDMVKLWTNFAKYGDPTPFVDHLLPVTWPPTKFSERRYLHIDFKYSVDYNPNGERYDFWDNIVQNI